MSLSMMKFQIAHRMISQMDEAELLQHVSGAALAKSPLQNGLDLAPARDRVLSSASMYSRLDDDVMPHKSIDQLPFASLSAKKFAPPLSSLIGVAPQRFDAS